MNVDLTQITTQRHPYFSLLIKDNTVIGCIKDSSFVCEQSECFFKRTCKVIGGDIIEEDY